MCAYYIYMHTLGQFDICEETNTRDMTTNTLHTIYVCEITRERWNVTTRTLRLSDYPCNDVHGGPLHGGHSGNYHA